MLFHGFSLLCSHGVVDQQVRIFSIDFLFFLVQLIVSDFIIINLIFECRNEFLFSIPLIISSVDFVLSWFGQVNSL